MRMLRFPNDTYLYHWTQNLANRGDMIEVDVEIEKGPVVVRGAKEEAKEDMGVVGELVAVSDPEPTVEEAPKKKAGRPKKVNDK